MFRSGVHLWAIIVAGEKERLLFLFKGKLEAAYEGGLKSVASVNLPAISDLARSLDLHGSGCREGNERNNVVKLIACLMPLLNILRKLA